MKQLFLLLTAACGLLLSTHASGEEIAKPMIAIRPFTLSNGFQLHTEIVGDPGNNAVIDQTLLNREISEKLAVFLDRSRRFTVVNREQLKALIAEQKLNDSDYVAPGQDGKTNQLQIADYMVSGTISRLDITARPVAIELTGEKSLRVTGVFSVQYNVTEVKSGKVLYANSLTMRMLPEDFRAAAPASERKDWTIKDYYNCLFDRTVDKIGNAIINTVYPIKIAAVQDGIVSLNRGDGAGLHQGTILEVYRAGTAVTDPDSGEVLGSGDVPIGRLEVYLVEAKLSRAKVIGKATQELERGMSARIVSESELKAEGNAGNKAAYPAASPGW